MSRTLVVGSESFQYPDQGDSPGWGGEATDWAQAVTNTLGTLFNSEDIPVTKVIIGDNVTDAQIAGLVIDPNNVRSAVIEYSAYRVASVTGPDYVEAGAIQLTYQNLAATGSKWNYTVTKSGDAGIDFLVADSGQVSYSSSALGATGEITFRAKTILNNI